MDAAFLDPDLERQPERPAPQPLGRIPDVRHFHSLAELAIVLRRRQATRYQPIELPAVVDDRLTVLLAERSVAPAAFKRRRQASGIVIALVQPILVDAGRRDHDIVVLLVQVDHRSAESLGEMNGGCASEDAATDNRYSHQTTCVTSNSRLCSGATTLMPSFHACWMKYCIPGR